MYPKFVVPNSVSNTTSQDVEGYQKPGLMSKSSQEPTRRLRRIDSTPASSYPIINADLYNSETSFFKTQSNFIHSSIKPNAHRVTEIAKPLGGFIATNFRNFADYTSMHGFRELYYAKSILWKFIWLLVIVAMIGLSMYQLRNSYNANTEKRTITTIQPLSSVIDYPSIRICYYHWVFWVKWEKGIKLGFDKASMLYGLSFLTEIATEIPIDEMSNAKAKFASTMAVNKFSNMMQFYDAISPETPPGLTVLYLNWTNFEKSLDTVYLQLCYELKNESIHRGLHEMSHTAANSQHTLELVYDYKNFILPIDHVTINEFMMYITEYLKSTGVRQMDLSSFNFSTLYVSPSFNVDNVRTNIIMVTEEMYWIRISIAGTFHKWLDNSERPCTKTKYRHYDYCDQVCKWLEMGRLSSNTSCVEIGGAQLIELTDMNKICRRNMYSLPQFDVVPGNQPQTIPEINRTGQEYEACNAKYCAIPCEEWIFENTMTIIPLPTELTKLLYRTLIDIQYPKPHSILVLTELPAQTWESSIGEIGGILGLWLGASVMSMLQMVYLCCCLQCDEKVAKSLERSRRK